MWFQDFSIADSRQVRLIHTNPLQDAQFPTRITKLCDFSYFSTVNPLQLHMLDTARRVSVNDFPIIIEGESGTEKNCWHRPSIRTPDVTTGLLFP